MNMGSGRWLTRATEMLSSVEDASNRTTKAQSAAGLAENAGGGRASLRLRGDGQPRRGPAGGELLADLVARAVAAHSHSASAPRRGG